MLRFLTAGESHGPELVATVEGVPAGFDIDLAAINADLARRQKGYGRGGRMLIEKDEVRPVSGIRFGKSLGSPITFIIENRDFKNWVKKMSADPNDRGAAEVVTRARPGHADLAGVLKYNLEDIRDVLERASARETTARVAIGGLAKQILAPFGIDVLGYVASIGATEAKTHPELSVAELRRITEASQVRVADPDAESKIIAEIDACKKTGDTLGGIVEVVATGLPVPAPSPSDVSTSPPLGVLLRLSMSGEGMPVCDTVRMLLVVSVPVGLLPLLSICSTGSVALDGLV